MKLRSLTSLILIISFAVGVVVIGAVILVRRKRARLQPKVERKHYPHEHLPSSEWEAKAKLTVVSYPLRDGDTLANVARLRYGHQKYAGVIKLFNHIDDETKIKAGTVLRLPDVSTILTEEGFTKVAAAETTLILCSRAKYDKVVDQLWALREHADAGYVLPEGVRQELLEAADDLEHATEGLKTPKAGVTRAPVRMIRQLEQSMWVMRDLAEGGHQDPNGYDIDIVQQEYGLALAYSIIWAREGFN